VIVSFELKIYLSLNKPSRLGLSRINNSSGAEQSKKNLALLL